MLGDVRVVDLSQYIPGPFATRQLADLGAEVIKIEPPGGDPMRHFMLGDEQAPSAVYRHLNRGKRVARLDLKTEAGRTTLATLIRDADILLESFRPGVLARLGFDNARLASLNPRLVHCALSGYGQHGPYAARGGHDINYCAASGQAAVSGSAERPLIGYPPIADHASALQAAIAILAALHACRRDGEGRFIDLSISESILAWQYLPMLGGASDRCAGLLNGGAACYNIYRCADGEFASLGAIEPTFWKNFCLAVNRPQWVGRQDEEMPQAALIAEVAAMFEAHSSSHWRDRLEYTDCCFEVLLDIADLRRHPQFAARQAVTAAGPAYPAHFDGAALATSESFEEIGTGEAVTWKSKRPG